MRSSKCRRTDHSRICVASSLRSMGFFPLIALLVPSLTESDYSATRETTDLHQAAYILSLAVKNFRGTMPNGSSMSMKERLMDCRRTSVADQPSSVATATEESTEIPGTMRRFVYWDWEPQRRESFLETNYLMNESHRIHRHCIRIDTNLYVETNSVPLF